MREKQKEKLEKSPQRSKRWSTNSSFIIQGWRKDKRGRGLDQRDEGNMIKEVSSSGSRGKWQPKITQQKTNTPPEERRGEDNNLISTGK